MADLGFGGRVLAGEDSEEDEEEEEAIGFQFGSSRPVAAPVPTPVQPTVQPKFNVQAPVAGAEDDESDEDEEEEDVDAPPSGSADSAALPTDVAPTPDQTPRVNIDSATRPINEPTTPKAPSLLHGDKNATERAAYQADWVADGSVDGVAMMGKAIVQMLQPSLDSTILRIAELTDSQERLLMLLKDQHKEICANDQIENVAIVMGKLPQYIRKVQDIKAAMTEISSSIERMKKRSESLRVDAQSHAIKKENKRESQSQWNKLYAAKSYEGATMSAAISSSLAISPPPPST